MTKSNYSQDIESVTFNKNGLWIKENLSTGKKRIIYANKLENKYLVDVKFFTDSSFKIRRKNYSQYCKY